MVSFISRCARGVAEASPQVVAEPQRSDAEAGETIMGQRDEKDEPNWANLSAVGHALARFTTSCLGDLRSSSPDTDTLDRPGCADGEKARWRTRDTDGRFA
jgi:hypothetical protein